MLNNIANNLGFGAGIDTPRLVSDLAAASRAPKIQRVDALARATQTKISAAAQAMSALESLSESLASTTAQASLRTQPGVSNEAVLSAVALSGAPLGELSAQIEVRQLAQSQTIYSGFVASAATPIGEGSLTLSVGGTDFNIAVTAANNSLGGLVTAINAAGSGVKASTITDGNGTRLVLKGETGAAKAFTLSANAGSDVGLNQFSFGGVGATMTSAQVAQDALFSVDGIAYSRASNYVTDAVTGVGLTLKTVAVGAPVSLSSRRPAEVIRQTLADFVDVFNELKGTFAEARNATNGARAIRALESELGALIGKTVTSDASINSLSDLGISTNRDGTISLDTKKLDALLVSNPDAVEAILAPPRDGTRTITTDPGIAESLKAISAAATKPDSPFKTMQSRFEKDLSNVAKDREKIEDREAAYRTRLERQFGALDGRIGALRATQSYLDQQIRIWTGGNN